MQNKISKVVVYRTESGQIHGTTVTYESGAHRDYSYNGMPETALSFILDEATKAKDVDGATVYTQEGETMNETTNTTTNTEEKETMTTSQAIEAIISYFEENEDEFIEVIEELDSYNGYLGDDRYYDMEMLDEFYTGCEPTEILERAYYWHDDDTWTTDEHGEKHYGEFCPNRAYFYYNGYGNLVSSDYKDYSAHLDKWFAEKLIDEAYNIDSIPDDVQSIIDSIED